GANCFLFASPEYIYSIQGPLKNALDATVRQEFFCLLKRV
uniref:NAD(P)H dehydrogenase (quinone) n=1 Tax=Aegilops tauschii subsp. strangulata TaxID=200361 RepID=A0A453GPH3_AEGTS